MHRWSALVCVLGLGVAGATIGANTPRPFAVAALDTVVVFGPMQFDGSNGQGQTYVEQFTTAATDGRLYTLRLVNGAADGTRRASKVIIKVNGFEVVSQNEVTQSVAELTRPVAVTDVDTIRVTVAGSGNPYATLSILSTADSSFNVAGPTQYDIPIGTTKAHTYSFSLPIASAPPHRLYVVNGSSSGTQRVTSASVSLNGTTVVSTSELTNAVGSLTKLVTLSASNTINLTLNGPTNSYITVRYTATDTTRPTLTIVAPMQNAVVAAGSVAVSGTVEDQTAAGVTINGSAASVTGTAYSGTATLAAEGSNLITVRATDASGRFVDSTRTVFRDTQAPALTVSAPLDNMFTRLPTVEVAANASDATALTVNTNGTPLTAGSGGSYTGAVAVVEGSNILATTATDAAGNLTSVVRTVFADYTPPALTVDAPIDGSTTTNDSATVSGTATDASALTVTVNAVSAVLGGGGAFSGNVPLVDGQNLISVIATDAAGNADTAIRSVERTVVLPPDPATVATAIDPTVGSTVGSSTAFLYSGSNPIQTGVVPGTIAAQRAAVLRGVLIDRDGAALPSVRVAIQGHPELGQTYSRADGAFDLAVNGGDALTLDFTKSGYLPAQRRFTMPWNDYVVADTVALATADTAVTTIAFTQPIEVARGSETTDSSGTRRATLLFEQGTQATLLLPDGSTQPAATLSVRATEFTVGGRGDEAMPGTLPPASAYTYAAELSADEAIAGVSPFDSDAVGEFRCPLGHVAGLNLVGQPLLMRDSWDGSDWVRSDVWTGMREGLLWPRPMLFVSRRVYEALIGSGIRGVQFEPALFAE